MMKWLIHGAIFLFVAAVVAWAFLSEQGSEDERAVSLLPALILGGMYLGGLFIMYILPMITEKATHMVYDSGEMVEADPLHDARAAYARGEYDVAIEVYRGATEADPYNRLPWVEIAKIQHDNLEDPDAAIETLRMALESHEWAVNDAAYFMGRLSEMYLEDKEDSASSIAILQQIIDTFPETRHSANATHKLREMGAI